MCAKPSGREDACDGGSGGCKRVAHRWGDVPTIGIGIGRRCIRRSHDKRGNTEAAIQGLRKELQAKFAQDQAGLQQQQVETQGKIDDVAASIQTLTLPVNNFKPVSEEDVGKARGEVSEEVATKLFATEEKNVKLNEELVKQSKVVADNSNTLQKLIVIVKNLGDNMVKMSKEICYWRETEVMDAEDGLAELATLIISLDQLK